jgi:anti-anti-sigma regulatory factor
MTVEGISSSRSHTWESARGRLVISEPTAGVIVFTYEGHMTAEVVPFIEATVDRVLAEGLRPDLFIDLDRLTSYDSAYRKAISSWGARLHRRFGEVRVFVRSRLVAMGIAVSNLTASNKLKPTTSRAQFQAALDESIRQRLHQAAAQGTA